MAMKFWIVLSRLWHWEVWITCAGVMAEKQAGKWQEDALLWGMEMPLFCIIATEKVVLELPTEGAEQECAVRM
jgi:hypothetical protein